MTRRITFLVVALLASLLPAQSNVVTFSLEQSTDGLSSWQRVPLTPEMVTNGGIGLTTTSSNAFYRMRIAVPTPPTPDVSLIPAGNFLMGNQMDPNEGNVEELPVHAVNVSAFYMDKYEVTKALWDEVAAWAEANGYDINATSGSGKADNHPIWHVTWFEAVKWCNARSQKEELTPCYTVGGEVMKTGTETPECNFLANGYRLPTEAEWEKAARGGLSGKRFPWGDAISHSQANYYSSPEYSYDVSPTREYDPAYRTGGFPYTSPVGSYAPNGYGLYDMTGNVWEWCWDFYDSSYYASSPLSDPRGSASGAERVLRGGGYSTFANSSRISRRGLSVPDYNGLLGFRCARSAVP
jgi:sulfatase modifying factor 1